MEALFLVLAQEKNERPNYGAILEYYRKLAGMTRKDLACYYSEALGKTITDDWIYRMERENKVPDDPTKRKLLAQMLGIPFSLFGLEPLEKTMSGLYSWEKIDVQEHRLTLESYNQGWFSGSLFRAASDIKARIKNLYRAAPNSSEKKDLYKLLCGYLVLLSDLARDHMEFDDAIDHLNSAVTIAEQEKFYDLWAYTLSKQGSVYEQRGEVTAGLKGYPAAQRDFAAAVRNFQAAQALESKVQPIFRGLVLRWAGRASAYAARDKGEFDSTLRVLDAASKEIGKEAEDLPIILAKWDEERYHLDKAAAYLAYPKAKASHALTARKELEQAADKSIHSLARDAFGVRLLAKSYLVEGQYPMAVAYTEDALSTVVACKSALDMAGLDVIYQQLRNDPSYGKSSDVIMLGVNLLKAQEPELFH
jgi:tetratricopeptide (TPR) repeat protein